GTLTPQKTSSRASSRLISTIESRTRSPIAPPRKPKPVHESEVTTIATARGRSVEAGKRTWRRRALPTNDTTQTNAAFTVTGRARPRKSAARFAGVASKGAERLRVPLAGDRERHREQPGQRRDLQSIADHVEPVGLEPGGAAEEGEEEHLEDRRDDERGEEDPGGQQVEERAVRDQPADEEDAEVGLVSESVWRCRAASRNRSSNATPTA